MKPVKSSVASVLWSLGAVLATAALIWFFCDPTITDALLSLLLPGMADALSGSTIVHAGYILGTSGLGALCVCFAAKKRIWSGLPHIGVLCVVTAAVFPDELFSLIFVVVGGLLGSLVLPLYDLLAKKLPKVFNRETVSYIVFGVLTTVVSFVSQMLFASLGTPAWVNTIGSWICAVIFAYVVNKLFVFESHTDTMKAFWRELGLFFAARLASLGMELVFMVITVDILDFSEAVCKLIAQVFILIANYVFSKLFIFRKNDE